MLSKTWRRPGDFVALHLSWWRVETTSKRQECLKSGRKLNSGTARPDRHAAICGNVTRCDAKTISQEKRICVATSSEFPVYDYCNLDPEEVTDASDC
jgi:hypothetical protein